MYRKYSNASDVWGYGIVLYELFTVGERPYGYVWSNNFVMESLQKGYRLSPPPGCSLPMYRLMINCWYDTISSSSKLDFQLTISFVIGIQTIIDALHSMIFA